MHDDLNRTMVEGGGGMMMTHHESSDSSLTLSVALSQSLNADNEEKNSKFQDYEIVEM
jgi:hypothetical protein